MASLLNSGIPENSLYAAKTSARQREMAGAPIMVKSSLYKNEFPNWGGERNLSSRRPLNILTIACHLGAIVNTT